MERETFRSRRLQALTPYVAACGLVALGLWLELVLARLAGPEAQFLPFSLAVVFSVWHGGLGPGLLAIALACIASDYFLLGPGILLWFDNRSQAYALTRFAAGWLGVGLIVHKSRLQIQRHRDALANAERNVTQADQLAQLAGALGRTRTSAAVFEASVQEPLHALHADAGMLILVHEDRESASVARTVGYPSAIQGREEPISLLIRSPLSDAVHRGAPVIVESSNDWRREYPDVPDNLRLPDYQTSVAVPLLIAGRVAAVVRLDFNARRMLTSHNREFLSALGSSAGQALDRVWQFESAQRARVEAEALRALADQELGERQKTERALRGSETRYRGLATRTARMHELTAALSEAVTVDAIGEAVVEHGSVLVGATAGAVSLLVEHGTQFQTLRAEEKGEPLPASERFPVDAGLCATEVAKTGEPIFVASWDEWQERYWRSASRAADAAHRSSAALPLFVEGTPLGVLEFHFNVPVNFDADYRALLVSVAQHCSQALDRARLYESAQRARAEAESANRLKDDFLSIVSHELRTPLNAVVGWASMLRDGSLKPELTARAVQSICDNATRQARLIDDLLDMSRIATGQATLDVQEIDLATLVAGVAESVLPKAASEQIDLHVQGIPAVLIRGDRRRLEQVFFNLIGNALKFTPAGGQIILEAACIDNCVELRVSDSGVGIEPEFLPHVFERFRQGDSTHTRSHGGLGLGLSIAKQFVEAHGGSITVASAGRNLGTTFSVRLPIARELPERPVPAVRIERLQVVTGAPRLDGIRVLVVDDDPDARDVMAHALHSYGAHVTSAASAGQAFALLSDTEIDVLLTDIAMPDEDGYSFIRRVRASPDPRIAAIPAAAVTAHAMHAEREQAFAAGFQSHVPKPVEPVRLARTVYQLARPRAAA